MTRHARRGACALATLLCGIGLSACGRSSQAGVPLFGVDAIAPEARTNPVAVSPLPGTPDASPRTQISFLGPAGTRVLSVRVVGSRSGRHAGSLRAYSTGTGESFLPLAAFAEGERVSVHARVRVRGVVQAASTTFDVARPAPIAQKQFPRGAGDPQAVQHYLSAPALTPSTVTILTPPQPGAAPGYLLLAPYQGRGTAGPMIVDQAGNLVWFQPLAAGMQASRLDVQRWNGRPALTWWQGRILELGFGQGEDVIAGNSYERLATVRAGNGYSADLHEFRLTPQGTAWITAFDPVEMNLTRAGGVSDGVLNDSLTQEIDVRTGLVMWEWHALGHIPLALSKNPIPESSYPWDFAHLNSADPGGGGDVLISVRNTWALYDLDIRSGATRWQLGGAGSSYRQPPAARFYWQHDAEFQPGGLISLFDNASDPPKEKQSRGLLLRREDATRAVSVVKAFANPARTLLAESQGNMQALPGGNWLLGYGRLPDFTEFGPTGRVLLDGRLGRDVQSFATALAPWEGRPASAPAIALRPLGGGMLVAASWNGATGVSSWRVLAGPAPTALAPVATVARSGFETRIAAPSAGPWFAVQALDAGGAVMASSPAASG